MTIQSAMNELKRYGTAQNRTVYARHGAKPPMFGVSYANLKVLTKKIKQDHELAVQLWATGNHDARVLATMIADPNAIDAKTLDAWAKDLDSYVVSDAFGGLAGKSRPARRKAETWMKSKNDYIGQAGWVIIARVALEQDPADVDDLREKLARIEERIHKAKNRTKHAMNMALCAIGIGCKPLRAEAIAAVKRIGKVEVDHGETGCKTPDAVAYIERAVKRGNAKRSR